MIPTVQLRQSLKPLLIGLLAASTQPLTAQTSFLVNGNVQNTYTANFTSNGSLVIGQGVLAEYMVVGGGGGGGGSNGGGGGGGGAVLSGNSTLDATQSHTVIVGAGGAGGANSGNATLRQGSNGGNSSFAGLSALGGGGGGAGGGGTAGNTGASGGGGGGRNSAAAGNGTSGQGLNGGRAGSSSSSNFFGGGGGGGAGGTGSNGSGDSGIFNTARGGNGGAGVTRNISGGNVTYGGGGGGGAENSGGGGETAGSGSSGGGSGSTGSGNAGSSGAANRGGGGGGAGNGAAGGSGGSGTVIVRYQGSVYASGGTISSGTGSATGYLLHTFNSTGTSALDFTTQDLSWSLVTNVIGRIESAGSFTYNGPGRLQLTGTMFLNSWINTGDMTIEAGTVSLCGSDFNSPGGYLGNYNYSYISPATSPYLMTAAVFESNITNNGTLILNTWNPYYEQRLEGDISGTGDLVISCSSSVSGGTVTLAGNNSYTGATIINSGTLVLEGNNLLTESNRIEVAPNGKLFLGGDQVFANFVCGGYVDLKDHLLTLGKPAQPSVNEIDGTLLGSGTLAVEEGSSLLFDASGDLYIGDFICGTGSTLSISSNSTLNSGSVITLNGGSLELEGDIVVGYLENNGGTVTGGNVTNALTLVESGTVTTTISDGVNFEAGILKQGATTATVNATQEFTGVVKVQEGTLALGSNGSFDASASVMTYDGATLDLNDQSQTVSAINGSGGAIDLGTGTLTVNCSTTNSTYGGSIAGTGGVVKDGGQTLALTGSNSYSGNTTVTEGTFLVDGSVNNSTVTVQNGATLGGSGSVGGLILESGSTNAPSGSLDVVGKAVWNGGATFDWSTSSGNADPEDQTGAGTSWSCVNIGGTLTFSGLGSTPFTINLATPEDGMLADWDPNIGSTWLLASADGGIFFDSTLALANTNYTSFFNIDSTNWTALFPASGFRIVTLANSTELYLQATAAVPEPGQVAASLLLLAGIGGYVWRKRCKLTKTVQPAK